MPIIDDLIQKYDILERVMFGFPKSRDILNWKYDRVFYILREKLINLI